MNKFKITASTIFFTIIIVLVLGAIAFSIMRGPAGSKSTTPGKYDTLATCLKDKGAVFYGAFWCPHCKKQKEEFGTSAKLLPYVECATPDGKGQTQICQDKKIEGYPTWSFANPLKITQKVAPIVCTKAPGKPGEDALCDRPGARSSYATSWFFPEYQVTSETEPTQAGDVWNFVAGSELHGEVQMATLAEQSGCTFPQ